MTEQHVKMDMKALRRDFRVPVQMDSFLYPVDGSWQGRKLIQTIDLSCGGIAFDSAAELQLGDVVEIVLPMMANPLIVQIRLIRKKERSAQHTCYAGKFIGLGQEEDQIICEAVFNLEIQNRQRA